MPAVLFLIWLITVSLSVGLWAAVIGIAYHFVSKFW